MTQEQIAQREIELKSEKESLEKFKADLLQVHEQLKGKTELFNALQERGIQTADDLATYTAPKKEDDETGEDKKEDKVTMPETTLNQSPEMAEMKKRLDEQQQIIQQQGIQLRTDKLMGQIKDEIKDKPEYALLEKGLSEDIAFNILRSQEADKQNNINKPLASYLKNTEEQLRGFYTKLGGKLEEKKPEGQDDNLFGDSKASTGENKTAEKPASSESVIDFPSLPASGSGDAPKQDIADAVVKLGTDPHTGRYDERSAREAFIAKGLESGKI